MRFILPPWWFAVLVLNGGHRNQRTAVENLSMQIENTAHYSALGLKGAAPMGGNANANDWELLFGFVFLEIKGRLGWCFLIWYQRACAAVAETRINVARESCYA